MDNYAIFASDTISSPGTIIRGIKNQSDLTGGNKVNIDHINTHFSKTDLSLFEEIYNENIYKIINFSSSYINNTEDAKNIAHDVFITFWKNRQNVNSMENVSPYLFASAKNMCLNYLRKKTYANKYSAHTLKEKTEYLNRVALENQPSLRIYENEVEKIIHKGMERMKPKVRRTFILSRMNGLKNREIACVEGIAESTVEARISSALIVMRKLLKDYL